MRGSIKFRTVLIDPDDRCLAIIRRAIQRGHEVIVIASPFYHFSYPKARELATESFETNTRSTVCLERVLRRLSTAGYRLGVIVIRDEVLEQAAIACRNCGIQFTPVQPLSIVRDKCRMRRALARRKIEAVRFQHASTTRQISTAVRKIGFPCVLKPVKGHGSLLSFKLRDLADVHSATNRISDWLKSENTDEKWALEKGFICEEWLDGPVVSVELACIGLRFVTLLVACGTVPEHDPCVGLGNILPIPYSVAARSCIAHAQRACRGLGITYGLCDVELALTPNGPVVIEINARKMGGEMQSAFEKASGIDFSDMVLDAYHGIEVRPRHVQIGKVCAIRKLIVIKPGTVHRANFDWVQSLCRRGQSLEFRNYTLFPGNSVRRNEVAARVLATTSSGLESLDLARRAVIEAEKETRLTFANLDDPARFTEPQNILCQLLLPPKLRKRPSTKSKN